MQNSNTGISIETSLNSEVDLSLDHENNISKKSRRNFFEKEIQVFIICLVIILASACNGTNKNRLEKQVRADIEKQFSSEAAIQGVTYRIESFDLVHVSGNEYRGLLKTTEDGNEISYSVYVTYDGNSYYWELQ